MGTALTEEQANLLARYAGKALLLYDSDAAGLKATFRTATRCCSAGVHPLVVTLPDGEDPDDWCGRAARGAEAAPRRRGGRARAQAADARGARLLRRHRRRAPRPGPAAADAAGDRRPGAARHLHGPRRAADGRAPGDAGARLERAGGAASSGVPAPRSGGWSGGAKRTVPRQDWAAERLLLMVLITDPAAHEPRRSWWPPEDLHDPRHREIYRALLERRTRRRGAAAVGGCRRCTRSCARAARDHGCGPQLRVAVADIQLRGAICTREYVDDHCGAAEARQRTCCWRRWS
jgi:hypothetical protein